MPETPVPQLVTTGAIPEFPRWVCSHAGKAPNRHTRRALATQARLSVKARKRAVMVAMRRGLAKLLASKAN